MLFSRAKGNVLIPADPYAEALIGSIAIGDSISVEAKKGRNLRFHRKFFALLQLGFDIWEPPADRMVRGQPVSKNFEKFREDITILAGHFDAVYGVDGSTKLVARSISFAKCDEFEFDRIYKSVLTVVWEKILRHSNFASEDEVERVVNKLIAFE